MAVFGLNFKKILIERKSHEQGKLSVAMNIDIQDIKAVKNSPMKDFRAEYYWNLTRIAGAKYKEVPLVFKNRAEGYSKNKVVNYTYDVITYAIDARLHKWGINFPLFYITRRAKTLIKFGVVGFTGTIVDFFFYKFFINSLGMLPATSKGFSAEIAILNNFAWNHFWTFRYRKNKTNVWQKLGIFNFSDHHKSTVSLNFLDSEFIKSRQVISMPSLSFKDTGIL